MTTGERRAAWVVTLDLVPEGAYVLVPPTPDKDLSTIARRGGDGEFATYLSDIFASAPLRLS